MRFFDTELQRNRANIFEKVIKCASKERHKKFAKIVIRPLISNNFSGEGHYKTPLDYLSVRQVRFLNQYQVTVY
jgi:hypothetical protein